METTFKFQSYRTIELAMLYFPNNTKEIASRLFRKCIQKNTDLQKELEDAKVYKYSKYYTPKQVRIIVKFLGEP